MFSSLYSYLLLFSSLICLVVGVTVYLRNKKSLAQKGFLFFATCNFIWLFCFSIAYRSQSAGLVDFWFKSGSVGHAFLIVTAYYFITAFLNEFPRERKWLCFFYSMAIFFVYSILNGQNFYNGFYGYRWGLYPKAGPLYLFYIVFLMAVIGKAVLLLRRHFAEMKSRKFTVEYYKIKYIFVSFVVLSFSCVDFISHYGAGILPVGFIFALFCLLVSSYAITRYRLVDMPIVMTRGGIFIFVYSLVLGFPFALGFGGQEALKGFLGEYWWVVPLAASTALATVGPYIYLYIQKKTEDKILKDQHGYQNILRRASLGMGRIKDLNRLLDLIVYFVARTVRIQHCSIYLFHEASQKYTLRAVKGKVGIKNPISVLSFESPVIDYIMQAKESIIFEEISQRRQDFSSKELLSLEEEMKKMDAALILPSFIEGRLIALIVLGKKKSGKLYTQDDIMVFSILANQSALVIENAQFYEETQRTHQQLLKAEKMATIGTMADGLSHQINNRLHAMGFIAGDALDTIKIKKEKVSSDGEKEFLNDMEYSFKRIEDNVKRGGEIVEGLLKYTRRESEGFEPVDIEKVLSSALEMAQFKIKMTSFRLIKNFDKDRPLVWGNFTQIQEVFFNLVDNAYDAMMQKKNQLEDPSYEPTLQIYAIRRGKKLEIVFKDNGIGVKKEDKEKLFTPFFTTKATSKKGTGLGLYVIRQIIEENHGGKVVFTAEYLQGAQTQIFLPIAREIKS